MRRILPENFGRVQKDEYFLYVIKPSVDLDSEVIDSDNWGGKLQYQQTMMQNKFKAMQTKIQTISNTQSENFKVQVSGLEKRIDRVKKSQA